MKLHHPFSFVVLALLPIFSACNDSGRQRNEGGHTHDSPHGGVAVQLGDHRFHLDFLADPLAGTLKAWVMDAHAEEFVRVSFSSLDLRVVVDGVTNALSLSAQANPATGETVGNTSQFESQADWLKGIVRFSATIPSVEIQGERFADVRFEYPAQK